jgi:hypothetical protein
VWQVAYDKEQPISLSETDAFKRLQIDACDQLQQLATSTISAIVVLLFKSLSAKHIKT